MKRWSDRGGGGLEGEELDPRAQGGGDGPPSEAAGTFGGHEADGPCATAALQGADLGDAKEVHEAEEDESEGGTVVGADQGLGSVESLQKKPFAGRQVRTDAAR